MTEIVSTRFLMSFQWLFSHLSIPLSFRVRRGGSKWPPLRRRYPYGTHMVRPLHGRGLKTASVAVSISTEHDITLTSFVADLPHPGLSNFYMMCEIDAKEGAKSLVLICAFALDISQENERGALGAEYFCRDTVGKVCITIHPGKNNSHEHQFKNDVTCQRVNFGTFRNG